MTETLLKVVLDVSEQMVQVGAEIHRVEESLSRMCTAYGAVRTDVYATTRTLMVSAECADGHVLTQTRAILHSGTDIERLDRLNALVRDITANTPDEDTVRARLSSLSRVRTYPLWVLLPAYTMIACAFCIFFGGRGAGEIIVSALIGLFVGFLSKTAEHLHLNRLLSRFLCSLLACLAAFVCLRLGVIVTVDNVIIGNIMLLIPGVGLTNALRDLFAGDSITGVLRFIEAILLALVIALGYVLAAFLLGGGI